jgi:hypothetical protein
MKRVLMLSSIAPVAFVLAVSCASMAPLSGHEPAQPRITQIDPYPADLADRGWSTALEFIEGRVRQWYADADIDTMSPAELAGGIAATSRAIATRRDDAPDELWWLREMMLRREVLCESLPAGHPLRSDYCSPTSYPGFEVNAA